MCCIYSTRYGECGHIVPFKIPESVRSTLPETSDSSSDDGLGSAHLAQPCEHQKNVMKALHAEQVDTLRQLQVVQAAHVRKKSKGKLTKDEKSIVETAFGRLRRLKAAAEERQQRHQDQQQKASTGPFYEMEKNRKKNLHARLGAISLLSKSEELKSRCSSKVNTRQDVSKTLANRKNEDIHPSSDGLSDMNAVGSISAPSNKGGNSTKEPKISIFPSAGGDGQGETPVDERMTLFQENENTLLKPTLSPKATEQTLAYVQAMEGEANRPEELLEEGKVVAAPMSLDNGLAVDPPPLTPAEAPRILSKTTKPSNIKSSPFNENNYHQSKQTTTTAQRCKFEEKMGKTIPNSKPLSPPSTFAIGSNNKIEQKPYYDPAAWNMVGCKERAKPTNSVKQQKEEKHFMDTKSLSPSTVLVNRSEESLNPFYRAAVQRWKQHKGIEQRDQRKTANFYASDSSYGRNQKHPSGTMFGDSIMKDMEESSDEEMTDTYFAQGIPKQDESDFEDEDDEISDDSMDYSDEEFSADDSSDEYYSDDDGYSDLEERLPKFPPYVPKPAYNAKGELVSGILKKRPSDENLSREGPTAAPKPAKKSLSWNPMAKARLFKRESGLDQYDAVTLPVTDAETLITDNNIAYRLSDEYKQKLWRESMKCTEACRQVKYHPKFTEKKDNSDTETNGVCPSCWEEAVRWLNKFRKHLNNARSNGGKVVKSTTFPNTRRPLPKRKLTSNYRQCHSIATFGNASAVNPWGMKKSKRISDDAVRQALTQVKLKSNLREKAARAGGIHARILYHLTIAPQRHSLT